MQEHTFEVIVSNVASISERPQLRIYFNEPVWTGVSLVQVMVCRFMFGTKPLPEPIPSYNELNPSKINKNPNIFFEDECVQNINHFNPV